MRKIQINLVRHGQTIFNHQDIVQGWGDSFLTPDGIQGVMNLGAFWQDIDKQFDAIYASDSGRTLQTARVLLDTMEVTRDIAPTPALREFNFGYFEGSDNNSVFQVVFERMGYTGTPAERSSEEMATYLDTIAVLDNEARGHLDNVYLAEDYQTYADRVVGGVEAIIADAKVNDKSSVLIVSHGLTIQTVITNLFEIANEDLPKSMGNASVSSFYVLPDGSLELIGFAEPLGQQ